MEDKYPKHHYDETSASAAGSVGPIETHKVTVTRVQTTALVLVK